MILVISLWTVVHSNWIDIFGNLKSVSEVWLNNDTNSQIQATELLTISHKCKQKNARMNECAKLKSLDLCTICFYTFDSVPSGPYF